VKKFLVILLVSACAHRPSTVVKVEVKVPCISSRAPALNKDSKLDILAIVKPVEDESMGIVVTKSSWVWFSKWVDATLDWEAEVTAKCLTK